MTHGIYHHNSRTPLATGTATQLELIARAWKVNSPTTTYDIRPLRKLAA